MDHCAFCAIIEGRAPASVVAETDEAIAFADLRQAVPGHVLVVPRPHVPDIHALQPGDAAALMTLAVRVARALRDAYDPPGISLWQSNGEAAMQEVPHVHLHVQPRQHGDGLLRVYQDNVPPEPSMRATLDEVAGLVRRHLRPVADQVPARP